MRNPNTICCICGKATYKRPRDLKNNLKIYCDKICYSKARTLEQRECKSCGKLFAPWNRRGKYCSKSCTNKSRSGVKYKRHKYPGRSANERRLNELKAVFKFTSCMVKGCPYNKTYDVHRLVMGKHGGKYEIGNMFAICPNHHAEVHRHLIELKKLSDCELEEIG